MYKNHSEYFDAATNPDYQKPVVKYSKLLNEVVVGNIAIVTTVDHPAAYLNNAPFVYTTAVVAWDKDTGVFETRNTRYVPE